MSDETNTVTTAETAADVLDDEAIADQINSPKEEQIEAAKEALESKHGLEIAKHEEHTLLDGSVEWRAGDVLHRPATEGPAVIKPDGSTQYWFYNVLHRPFEDGPAISRPDGYQAHFVMGKLHNPDGPAITTAKGSEAYYVQGKCSRENNEPAIILRDGREIFMKEGKHHRTNGPVYKDHTTEIWKQKGQLTRDPLEGPAFESTEETVFAIGGHLHNIDGPARIKGGERTFALFGQELYSHEYEDLAPKGFQKAAIAMFKEWPETFDIACMILKNRGGEENIKLAKKMKFLFQMVHRSTRDAGKY